MSRFSEDLEERLRCSTNEVEYDCIVAERAAYFARLGRTLEARQDISKIRSKNATKPRVEISIWISIASGIVDFYDDMSLTATDGFMRARALSRAAGLNQLQATAEAWLAHMAFSRYDFRSMCAAISEALTLVHHDSHSCLARVSLVVGESLHLAGLREAAITWYRRAQAHSVSVGDETLISALLYNMTALRIAMSRRDSCQGVIVDEFSRTSVSGADSTANFDQLTGIVSLESITPILRAQALSVAGSFQEALSLYSTFIDPAVAQGLLRHKCWLMADRAWCEMNLGMVDAARASAADAKLSITEHVQIDDLAATHNRLQQVYASLNDKGLADHHADLANQLWVDFESVQKEIVDGLYYADEKYLCIK